MAKLNDFLTWMGHHDNLSMHSIPNDEGPKAMRALMIRWYLCGGWSWLVFSSLIFTLKPFVPNKTYTSLFVPHVELHVHEMYCVKNKIQNVTHHLTVTQGVPLVKQELHTLSRAPVMFCRRHYV
jgi:hypothetical protein